MAVFTAAVFAVAVFTAAVFAAAVFTAHTVIGQCPHGIKTHLHVLDDIKVI